MDNDVCDFWVDMNPRQMENAALVFSSWQRPVMLMDPYEEATSYLNWLCRLTNKRKLVSLDMDTRLVFYNVLNRFQDSTCETAYINLCNI